MKRINDNLNKLMNEPDVEYSFILMPEGYNFTGYIWSTWENGLVLAKSTDYYREVDIRKGKLITLKNYQWLEYEKTIS